MKILIACEHSGVIRDAFSKLGHDVTSCDLLPAETPGKHYQGDVFDILFEGWDMMIAHPPCTYLSTVGNGFFNIQKYGLKAVERWQLRIDALEFFMKLYNAPIDRVCIENPQGFPNTAFRKPDQTIHPYYFGESALKRTCLWLKNLPLLKYASSETLFERQTAIAMPEPLYVHDRKATGKPKKRYFTDVTGRGEDQWKIRSKTFESIAQAMATQWGYLDANRQTEAA